MAVTREEIIEALKEMSLLEASELVKDIEETFGVSAAAPVAVAAAAPAEGGAAAEEKSDFDVVLEGFGQGGRRGRSEGCRRGREQGQGRGDQGEAGRGRRRCDPEVNSLSRKASPNQFGCKDPAFERGPFLVCPKFDCRPAVKPPLT